MASNERHMKPPPPSQPKFPVDASTQKPQPFNLKEYGQQLGKEIVDRLNWASTRNDSIRPPKPFNLKEFGKQLAEEAAKKLNKLP